MFTLKLIFVLLLCAPFLCFAVILYIKLRSGAIDRYKG
jgi:phage shock protein PspC (stress-responsive transcriptional regulator)